MRILPLLVCAALLGAADSAVATAARTALAGSDPYAKRDAVKALADKNAVDDDTAYQLIAQAVGDRAAHDAAVLAFRARSGLTPPVGYMGNSAYPAYPANDDAAAYTAWAQARKAAADQKKKLDELTKPKPGAKDPAKSDAPADAPAPDTPADVPPPRIPTDNLGKLDRIVYTSGRSLVAYVRSKRVDADGKLISVRVVHKDGAGEEVIDASQIARIEEDIE